MIKKRPLAVLIVGCIVTLTATLFSTDETLEKHHATIGTRAGRDELATTQSEKSCKKVAADFSDVKMSQEASNLSPFRQAAKSVYSHSHPAAYQHPVSISFSGQRVELMDGSLWQIAPSDAFIVVNWFATDLVVITPNHAWFSGYTFCLTNQRSGESVSANLNLGPIDPAYGSLYTHWIVAIDDYYNRVYLEDGSIWSMSAFDSQIVSQWIVGDVVIIGVNDGWLSSSNPNVLINVAILDFAAGSASF